MVYPSHLIPKRTYRLIADSALGEGSILLRRISTEQEKIPLDDFGEVPTSVFLGSESLSRLNGLSLNLLGVFLPSDISVRAIPAPECPDPHAYWNPGSYVPAASDIDFEMLDDVAALYLSYSWWHEQRFPVKDEVNFSSGMMFSGQTRVTHRPTVTNFWHLELHFAFSDGSAIQNSKATWKKKAYEFVLRDAISARKSAISTRPLPHVKIKESAFS